MKEGKLNYREKINSKLLADGRFMCSRASVKAAMIRDMISGMLYISD
jgi:hypothetical protein